MSWPEHPDCPRTATSSRGPTSTGSSPPAPRRRAPSSGRAPRRWRRFGASAGLAAIRRRYRRPARARRRRRRRDRARGTTTEVSARYVIVADGSLSRFGRALGTARNRDWPQGMALRGYYRSPRHAEAYIDSFLDIRDADGKVVPGYGWIFPLGDGRVNVGVGLLSTQDRWKHVNTTKLMEAFVAQAPASWCLDAGDLAAAPRPAAACPMGLAVGPRVGPDCIAAGDAAGAINPFNGEGIAYAYETGRLAAAAVSDALAGARPAAARRATSESLRGHLRPLLPGRPCLHHVHLDDPGSMRALRQHRACTAAAIMEWLLRIMGNYLRPDELGPAEAVYRAVAALARQMPES